MLEFLYVDANGDYIETINDATGEQRTCDVESVVGDMVMNSETVDNGVDSVVDNWDDRDVIGIITEKPTTTTCIVMTKGRVEGLSGLTKAQKVYLGADGAFTSTKPTDGYVRVVGHAIDADKVNFDPINTKILTAPIGYETQAEAEANPESLDTSSLAVVGDTMTQYYNV